jgi:hypothetical protein
LNNTGQIKLCITTRKNLILFHSAFFVTIQGGKMNRTQRRFVFLSGLIVFAVFLLPNIITAFSGGPPDGRTGAPGESTCAIGCHTGSSGGNGSLALNGVPVNYEIDSVYTMTVELQDPGQMRWGFELTATDGNSNGVGSFIITDALNTQLSDNSGNSKDYVKHTSTGTQNGTPDGPVTWQFDWQAPSVDVGVISFYVAGNAANGNFANSGDFIYTISESAQPPVVVCQGICGDANNDISVNVSDAVWIVNFVFVGGGQPMPILACGDANTDAAVNVSDAVWIINYVFVGGAPPSNCSPGSWDGVGGDCCGFVI